MLLGSSYSGRGFLNFLGTGTMVVSLRHVRTTDWSSDVSLSTANS